jgi:hypothetical protein
VTIAGDFQSELGCTGDWQPDCATTHLTYDAGDDAGRARGRFPAGNWSYKAAINDAWAENYGAGAVANGPSILLNLGASSTVKFYYDPNSHWVTSNHNSRIVTAREASSPTWGCPGDWQPDCLRSWLEDPDGDGTYTRTTTALTAGDYETKAAINESWDENYGPGGVPGGGNILFNVPADDRTSQVPLRILDQHSDRLVGDATDPLTSTSTSLFAKGGQINSYPVLINWTASDDVSADATLRHKVQVRRWLSGTWGPWSGFGTVTGIPQ